MLRQCVCVPGPCEWLWDFPAPLSLLLEPDDESLDPDELDAAELDPSEPEPDDEPEPSDEEPEPEPSEELPEPDEPFDAEDFVPLAPLLSFL